MPWKNNIHQNVIGSASLDQFPDTDEGLQNLTKSYVEAQKMLGKKRIAIPTESSSEDDLREFRSAIGVPEDHNNYELPESFTDDDSLKEALKKKALELHMPKGQLAPLLELLAQDRQAKETLAQETKETEIAALSDKLKTDLGDKYEDMTKAVKNMVTQFGDDSLAELVTTELGNNEPFARFMFKMAEQFIEDTNNDDTRQNKIITKDSPEDARQQMQVLMHDREFLNQMNDKNNPKHTIAKAKWMSLQKIASQ